MLHSFLVCSGALEMLLLLLQTSLLQLRSIIYTFYDLVNPRVPAASCYCQSYAVYVANIDEFYGANILIMYTHVCGVACGNVLVFTHVCTCAHTCLIIYLKMTG